MSFKIILHFLKKLCVYNISLCVVKCLLRAKEGEREGYREREERKNEGVREEEGRRETVSERSGHTSMVS